MNSKKLILGAVGFILLIALGIGGYFLAVKVGQVHDENVDALAGFGSAVTPISRGADDTRSVTTGVDGQLQIPSSIGEENLAATDKIIISLSKEKEALVSELAGYRKKVAKLEQEVALLQNYKDNNERFAPRLLKDERERAIKNLASFLEQSKDADRFTEFQKEAMALESANVYLDVLKQYQLSLKEEQKDLLLSQHLPPFAFCIGDSIGIVANDRREEAMLLKYFRTNDPSPLSPSLKEDIDTIKSPCIKDLNSRINSLL
ncbi:hypothetical protein [Motiliproteus sp. MSK22-1]|uniref:hypothetical protein n=1 Tax=Motiliproteus sp. MSK22-1 TaxID=1897630 RepID=UPI000976330F|nr:hypothetical protein [Motiliproteus sp. MSK22-1]OMH36235.1 hypothetical protein BGP75_09790 [Motiliproteus sp. MSK22-1]